MNGDDGDNADQIHITFDIQQQNQIHKLLFFSSFFSRFVNQGKHLLASRKKDERINKAKTRHKHTLMIN